MIPRPQIFISAVSKELKSARQLIADKLQLLGYDPVRQDIFGTGAGDLRAMLRKQIDECKGVVQLIGQRYGAEPPTTDEQFGRVSYTQYEALYARQQGKKVWYFILDKNYPTDSQETEAEELSKLQAAYRQQVQTGTHLFHPISTKEGLTAKVHEIRDELTKLRRRFTVWAKTVIALLVIVTGLVICLLFAVRLPEVITDERANAVFIAGDYAAAFDLYIKLSDSDPANIFYHRRIEECARSGNLEKQFIARYIALVKQQSKNAIYHNYLGNAFLILDPQDKDGKAREHYIRAIRLDSDFPAPLANLGIVAHRAGQESKAESFFKRYLEAQPDDAQGWVNLGLLYVAKAEVNPFETQNIANAEKAMRQGVYLEPSLASAYKGLGRLFTITGRKKEALDAYQRSYALDHKQSDVRQQIELLAWESGATRMPGTGLDDFKTRGRSGDEKTIPYVVLAMQLLEQKQYRQALVICLEWIKVEPESLLTWRLLERSYQGEGRYDEALNASNEVDRLMKVHAKRPDEAVSSDSQKRGNLDE